MELEPSWGDDGYVVISREDHTSETYGLDLCVVLTCVDYEDKKVVCINSILPDDVLERVLCRLPISTIIKAGCVCKKWNDMLHSERFIASLSRISPHKPWYFMFTSDSDPQGHVYDPVLLKWYRYEFPHVESSSWNLVSSSGLVCFMDNISRRKLYVCNPITRYCRRLEEPLGAEFSDYCALAISVDKSSQNYIVTIVESRQDPEEELYWDLSINIYSSEKKLWVCTVDVTLEAWRGGSDSVICNGVLYFVVYLTRTLGFVRPRYGVLAYDLASEFFEIDVDEHVISAPCPVTCMRLMNLEEELVMVGGIEKQGRAGIIKGIGVWVLRGKEWEEVSRMPNKYFRGFGEFDDVFASSGFGKVIYIQGFGSPALLMFDMSSKEWGWSYKCPATKKFPLQLFTGICFEPRLDLSP